MRHSLRFPHLLTGSLLAETPGEAAAAILDDTALRSYSTGDVILMQGELSDGVHLLAKGQAEVSYICEAGNRTILYQAGPGSLLGLIEGLAYRPCAAGCTASTRVEVLYLPIQQLAKRIDPQLLLRTVASITHDMMIRDTLRTSVNRLGRVEQRICGHLYMMGQTNEVLHISQAGLAVLANCTRQSANKELGTLRDLGLIELGKGRITIRDLAALARRIEALDESALQVG